MGPLIGKCETILGFVLTLLLFSRYIKTKNHASSRFLAKNSVSQVFWDKNFEDARFLVLMYQLDNRRVSTQPQLASHLSSRGPMKLKKV